VPVRVIGLTGTIGAGKSTVMRWLGELGAHVMDADALVSRLYESDQALQRQLQARFGARVVANGRVDRQELSKIVFAGPEDRTALADLEAIVHPAVHRLEDEAIAAARAAGAPACVVEAIKLVESGGSSRCDELWIVTAAEVIQLARLAARGLGVAEARRRLAAQGTVASWTAAFHEESARLGRSRPVIVVDNSGGEVQGRAQVERLWYGLDRSSVVSP
jgi:dephospho-CoA kinase